MFSFCTFFLLFVISHTSCPFGQDPHNRHDCRNVTNICSLDCSTGDCILEGNCQCPKGDEVSINCQPTVVGGRNFILVVFVAFVLFFCEYTSFRFVFFIFPSLHFFSVFKVFAEMYVYLCLRLALIPRLYTRMTYFSPFNFYSPSFGLRRVQPSP